MCSPDRQGNEENWHQVCVCVPVFHAVMLRTVMVKQFGSLPCSVEMFLLGTNCWKQLCLVCFWFKLKANS